MKKIDPIYEVRLNDTLLCYRAIDHGELGALITRGQRQQFFPLKEIYDNFIRGPFYPFDDNEPTVRRSS